MDKYSEYQLVQRCLQLIEEKLDWGSSEFWHNDVFIELSDTIQQQTKVLLSPTTLKRVWGKIDYKNAPSISTLNTLAQFAGYLNWRDFKNQTGIKTPSWVSQIVSKNFGVIITSAAIMTLVFISFYSLDSKNNIEKIDDSKVKFSSRSVALGLPNSVVFNFDLNGINSDSILIQQFWDETKTIKINKEQTQATGQYYYPGFFRAKLLVDGHIIKEHDLFIKSQGWLGTIDYEPIPKYLKEDVFNKSNLSFTESVINEIASSDDPLVSSFHYVDDLNIISGDDFTLSTAIRNLYNDKWAVCQKATIVIVGTKSAFLIPFSISGCVSENSVMLGDLFLNGKEHDLSSLSADLSEFQDIKIETKNKKVTISIDNENVFSRAYTKSIGDIVGVRFRFLGAGEIGYLNLLDSAGKVFMDRNFSSEKE